MKSNRTLSIPLLALASITVAQAGPITIASTTADYTGTDGANGWKYGYYTESATAFTTSGFTYGGSFDGWWAFGNAGASNYALIGSSSTAHPGLIAATSQTPQINFDTVREYTSTYTGPVNISGNLHKQDTGAPYGQLITGNIYLNGSLIYHQSLNGNDGTGYSYSLNQNIVAGDVLDFVVSAGTAATVGNDLTVFSAVLTATTPEPSTWATGSGLLGVCFLLRRKWLSIKCKWLSTQ